MKKILQICWKALSSGGGWAPIFVFVLHIFLHRVVHIYLYFPSADVPMHFLGGIAIAYFVSRCFQLLPREAVVKSRVFLLELLLIGSLTASVAVCWEFAEFTFDQLFGYNVQISLANTMIDLAMGLSGAIVFILIRSRQLHIGTTELQEITFDWIRGQVA